MKKLLTLALVLATTAAMGASYENGIRQGGGVDASITNGYVKTDITNGLATVSYVDGATNAIPTGGGAVTSSLAWFASRSINLDEAATPAIVTVTNANGTAFFLAFDEFTAEIAGSQTLQIPAGYNTNFIFHLHGYSSGTTGTVEWVMRYRLNGLNVWSTNTFPEGPDEGSLTEFSKQSFETNGINAAPGDLFEFEFFKSATNATTDATGDYYVRGIALEFIRE